MQTNIKGTSHVFGKNIDTDQIYPGFYLELTEPADIGKHCMQGIDSDFSAKFVAGDIIVAGTNFGCGSSREHAPISLKAIGTSAIIADSFARIFYRNAINMGIPLITCPNICDFINDKDTVSIDFEKHLITNNTTGKSIKCEPISDYAMEILNAGGIKEMILNQMK